MPSGIYKRTKKHRDSMSKGREGIKLSEEHKRNIGLANTGKKRTKEARLKMSKVKLAKSKENKYTYRQIHYWLVAHFGLAKQCEYCKVLPEDYRTAKGLPSKRYPIQYALIKGKQHSRNRESYICLCYGCHGEYDTRTFEQNK
jgi:hypothetical protein|tara:strand:+ start:173 stop:601 length:429 start_codon:yes stop_codon:yes gene_type:complete